MAPVRPDALARTEQAVAEIAADVEGNRLLPLGAVPGLHFASLVLVPARGSFEATLVFEANVDGSVADLLDALVRVAGSGIDVVWGGCAEYPAGDGDPEAARRWLGDHVVLPAPTTWGPPG